MPLDRAADRLDRRAVAPLGEVRHRFEDAHPHTLGAVKEYYDARAPEYDDCVARARTLRDRHRQRLVRGGHAPARRDRVAPGGADARRRLRHRLPDAASARRRHRPRPERRRCSTRRAARCRTRRSSRATRSTCRSRTALRPRCSRASSTATSKSDDRERFLAEAAASRASSSFVDASRERAAVDAEHQQRILNDGSTLDRLQALLRAEELADELGGGEILLAGRWFVVVRA